MNNTRVGQKSFVNYGRGEGSFFPFFIHKSFTMVLHIKDSVVQAHIAKRSRPDEMFL